jgi:hypothetical protein
MFPVEHEFIIVFNLMEEKMKKHTKRLWTFVLVLVFFMIGTMIWAKGQSGAASK